MPTAPATGGTTAQRVEEQFVDLVCNDPDLLAAEFDSIIAAEWAEPPADRPGRGAAGEHPVSGAGRRAAGSVRGPASQPRHPSIGGWSRQRSPPPPRQRTTT